MNRDEAHAAIVLILSDMPRDYKFTDAADDILDAIGWGVTASDALDALWETFVRVRDDLKIQLNRSNACDHCSWCNGAGCDA